MQSYNHSLRKKLIFGVTCLILMIVIGVSNKNRTIMDFGSNAVGSITSPVTKIFYVTTQKVTEGFEKIFGSRQLREEHGKLVQENKELKEKVQVMESVINREEALEKEYELLKNTSMDLKPTYITAKDPTNYFIRFNIDKGTLQGVEKNSVIVQAADEEGKVIEGLVGRVVQSGLNFSKVSTIIDENSNVSFRVKRSGEIGILSGTAESGMTGYMYQHDADINIGDKIYTSGLGGVYPRDIYIGEITDITQEDDGLMKYVEVESPVDFSKLYRVFVATKEDTTDEQN